MGFRAMHNPNCRFVGYTNRGIQQILLWYLGFVGGCSAQTGKPRETIMMRGGALVQRIGRPFAPKKTRPNLITPLIP